MPPDTKQDASQPRSGLRDDVELWLDPGSPAPTKVSVLTPGSREVLCTVAGIPGAIEQAATRTRGRVIIPDLELDSGWRSARLVAPGTARTLSVRDAIRNLRDAGQTAKAELVEELAARPGLFGPIQFSRDRNGLWRTTAARRRTGHLLIIAAPSGGGKSTLMRRIARPLGPIARCLLPKQSIPRQAQRMADAVSARLELPVGRIWGCVSGAKYFSRMRRTDCDYFLLQYELSDRGCTDGGLARLDDVLDLMSGANEVTAITISTPAEVLNEQKRARSRRRSLNRRPPPAVDHTALTTLYRRYIRAVQGHVDDHVIVLVGNPGQIQSPGEWLDQ